MQALENSVGNVGRTPASKKYVKIAPQNDQKPCMQHDAHQVGFGHPLRTAQNPSEVSQCALCAT